MEEAIDELGRRGGWTNEMIRESARSDGIPEKAMFRIWNRVVPDRELTPYLCGPLDRATQLYKEDPEKCWAYLERREW